MLRKPAHEMDRVTALTLEDCTRQIERVARSQTFAGAELVRKLLEYLAKRAIEAPGAPTKEWEIATQVLGKDSEFDPRVDPHARVIAGRLRSKLAEYYVTEGADDPIYVELPKRSYSLTFSERKAIAEAPVPSSPSAPIAEKEPPAGRSRLLPLAAVVFAVVAAALWFYLRPAASERTLRAFWGPFLDAPEAPLAVFSNPEFFGSPSTGMRFFRPETDVRHELKDTYTGVGEVVAASELSRLFANAGRPLTLKRAQIVSWDDAKTANVIFIGAPNQNPLLSDVQQLQSFTFKRSLEEPEVGRTAVINTKPEPGERALYSNESVPGSPRSRVEYAVIGLHQGIQPKRWTMVLAGTTTHGTQAAAEWVCRAESVAELWAKTGSQVRPFEALLEVTVRAGVPVNARVVAFRVFPAAAS